MFDITEWISKLKPRILEFLKHLRHPEIKGFYSYSMSGDMFSPTAVRWGLGNTVFAAKTYYMLDSLDHANIEEMAAFIKSFQTESGDIYDPLIKKKSVQRRLFHAVRERDFNNIFNQQTRTAETRQAFAALLSLGEKPLKPYKSLLLTTKEEIEKYIRRLNWKKPWGAASHVSHLIFFLKNNPDKEDNVEEFIDYALSIVEGYRQSDGGWYESGSSITSEEKVNGAMKMMLAYETAERNFSYPERLIDLSLLSLNSRHACDNFNVVCVVYHCAMKTDYKRDYIMDFCLKRFNSYTKYYWPEYGGFSFNRGYANKVYYGATITNGLPEPDIHGTMLYLWGIGLISEILNLKDDFRLKAPIT